MFIPHLELAIEVLQDSNAYYRTVVLYYRTVMLYYRTVMPITGQ